MTHGRRRRSGAAAMSIAACVLCASWTMASPESARDGQAAPAGTSPARAQAPPGKVDVGAALYRKVGCYQCHVNEAQGGANGPKLGPDPVPFARFSQYTRKPTGDMPPYSEKVLSAQDIADIYAFVQSRPRPPAVSAIPLLAP
jgi:mono/diheme cytochrome c family protein